MTNSIYDNYLETEILSADPVTLVRILYGGAVDAVASARRFLRDGVIQERSLQITKAYEILGELAGSLNHEKGGELSRNLASLYSYMQRRLIEANLKQSDAPLADVERLLCTLRGAWSAAPASPSPMDRDYAPISCSC